MVRYGAYMTRSAAVFPIKPTFKSLELSNFLSYKAARLDFGEFVALVGPNASGKSNLVAALKLLREIPLHGLPTAIARRGGFDQLRHRSAGRPYDPSLKITWHYGDSPLSSYEIRLGAIKGKRYEVKEERSTIHLGSDVYTLLSDGHSARWSGSELLILDENENEISEQESGVEEQKFPIPPGQSALSSGGFAGFLAMQALQTIQTVEVNPALVGHLQEPSSTRDFEPDGSNTTSIYENLGTTARSELVDQLAAIVPGIVRIEVKNLADLQTLSFIQQTASGGREFYAKQMSDGTLRAFSILLAMAQTSGPGLLIIEEPEIAIHLGALRTMVDILREHTSHTQIVITTHSADIVDSLPVESLQVVWSDGGASRVGPLAEHTRKTLREGLITPGQLLRADSLDPAEA